MQHRPVADAGISIAGGGNEVGLGDHGATASPTGARAEATTNSVSLAISTGLNEGAYASASGNDNTAVSIDGVTIVSGEHDHGFTALGRSDVYGTSNNVVTVGGYSGVGVMDPHAHDNFVVNFGSSVTPKTLQDNAPGAVSVSVCGTSIGAQADHINVNKVPDGLC